MRRYFPSHHHGGSRFCISLLSFASLARETTSKPTSVLGCWLLRIAGWLTIRAWAHTGPTRLPGTWLRMILSVTQSQRDTKCRECMQEISVDELYGCTLHTILTWSRFHSIQPYLQAQCTCTLPYLSKLVMYSRKATAMGLLSFWETWNNCSYCGWYLLTLVFILARFAQNLFPSLAYP